MKIIDEGRGNVSKTVLMSPAYNCHTAPHRLGGLQGGARSGSHGESGDSVGHGGSGDSGGHEGLYPAGI